MTFNMNKIWIYVFLPVLVFLAACSTTITSTYKSPSEVVKTDGRGLVWVFNAASAPPDILRMKNVEIFVDDIHIGNIGANGHALLAIRPGSRVVKAAWNDSYPLPTFTKNGPTKTIAVELGKQSAMTVRWVYDSSSTSATYNGGTLTTTTYKVFSQVSSNIPEALYKSNQDLVFTEK